MLMKVAHGTIACGPSKKMLETLPMMRPFQESTDYGSTATRRQHMCVLSERWAREAALHVHGGESGLSAYLLCASTKSAMIAYQRRVAHI